MKGPIFFALFLLVFALPALAYPPQVISPEMIQGTSTGDEGVSRICCSWHGGVCGCTDFGSVVCCDGVASPACNCELPEPFPIQTQPHERGPSNPLLL